MLARCIQTASEKTPELELSKEYEVAESSKPGYYKVLIDGSYSDIWYPKRWFRLI